MLLSLRHAFSRMLIFSSSTWKKIEPKQLNLLCRFNYWIAISISVAMLKFKMYKNISNKNGIENRTCLCDAHSFWRHIAITSWTLTNNNVGLLRKLCFYMLYTPVQYNCPLGKALRSFPETNAASDKNSDLLGGDQNLQDDEAPPG